MWKVTQPLKDGSATELEVLSVIRTAPRPIQAWEIQKKLKYTSGKLQSALRRLERNRKIIRKKVTRVTENQQPRVISLVWDRDFEAHDEVPTQIIEKEIPVPGPPVVEQPLGFDLVHWFEVLEPIENPQNPEEVAIPIKLSKFEAQLLAAIPHVNKEFGGVTDFIQKAVTQLLKKQKNEVKRRAVRYLINQGTITEEYGRQLLGLRPDQNIDEGNPDE